MIATPDLVDVLSRDLKPVRSLRPPFSRAIGWLLLATLVLAVLAVGQGVRPDLAARLDDPAFAISMAASLLTGILAAVTAFMVSVPGRSRLWLLLPTPALLVWLSTISIQCLTNWVTLAPDGIRLADAARCFATLVLTSLPLSLALLVMLRHAALLRPTLTAMTGSLAVAALTASALPLFHRLDATVMILIWNLGTAVLIVGLGGAFGRKLFSWVTPSALVSPS